MCSSQIDGLFEVLAQFPSVIQAISEAHLLFDPLSDDEEAEPSPASDIDLAALAAANRKQKDLAQSRASDDPSSEGTHDQEEGESRDGKAEEETSDRPTSFFRAHSKIRPPRLDQFTRGKRLQSLEETAVGYRSRPVRGALRYNFCFLALHQHS